jgi:hypothetical protein
VSDVHRQCRLFDRDARPVVSLVVLGEGRNKT